MNTVKQSAIGKHLTEEHEAMPRDTGLSYLRNAPDVKQETEIKHQR